MAEEIRVSEFTLTCDTRTGVIRLDALALPTPLRSVEAFRAQALEWADRGNFTVDFINDTTARFRETALNPGGADIFRTVLRSLYPVAH